MPKTTENPVKKGKTEKKNSEKQMPKTTEKPVKKCKTEKKNSEKQMPKTTEKPVKKCKTGKNSEKQREKDEKSSQNEKPNAEDERITCKYCGKRFTNRIQQRIDHEIECKKQMDAERARWDVDKSREPRQPRPGAALDPGHNGPGNGARMGAR